MSDGDGATPRPEGNGRPEGSDGDFRSTRTPRPQPGAAPWERRSARRDVPPRADDDDEGGQHTGGTGPTVADLIAKVSGQDPSAPASRQRDIAADPPTIVQPAVDYGMPAYQSGAYQRRAPEVVPEDATAPLQAMPAPLDAAFASELPDLEAVARRKRVGKRPRPASAAEETTILPPTRDRVRPRRAAAAPRPEGAEHSETSTPRESTPRRRRAVLAGRATTAVFAICALALTGGAWQWTTSKNNSLTSVNALDTESRDIIDPDAQYGDENFLIVGVDSRAGANSEIGAGSQEDAGGARSDTVILVNIPANRERVVAVSFPRDLAIEPTECDAWNPDTNQYGPLYDETTGTYGPETWYTETKLNSTYAYGGPKCLVKVIQQISGLRINRFMAVDFVGFSKVVDALGGVEVCSTTPIEDYELGMVLPNPGRQVIDGHTALNYVRARQVTTEINGDYGRIKRQQLFLSSLLRSMISTDTFFSLTKLNNVVNMFIGDTTVDNVSTKDLVNLGQSLQNVAAGRITFVTVPTVGYADEWGNEVPRDDDIRALFDAIINDDPLPGEENADGTPTAQTTTPESTTSTPDQTVNAAPQLVDAVTTEPTDVTVHVSNSTGESGLAATAATELENHGFIVTSPDDYPSTLATTTVFFGPGNEQAAATVASSFGTPNVERVSGMGDVVQVVLGSDFYSVSAPQPSGSPVPLEVTDGTYEESPSTPLPDDLTVTNAADTTCE